MKALVLLITAFFTITTATAQDYVKDLKDMQPDGEYENIHVKKVYTDSTVSCFVIWVKKGVKAHYHADHTENLVVVEGTGVMKVGEEEYEIGPNDYIVIPKGTIHSVKVTSKTPLKVISLQSPEFLGKDRVFVE